MIRSELMDVEIFPNLFSVTFVDLKDYLDTFKDCVNDKGKPVALTEKLTVKEIKERLDKVKSKVFYISDTDDSQLLELVSYINSMEAYYQTQVDDKGCVYQIAHRTDLYGFNNHDYDDMMIRGFMMKFNRFDSTKHLITWLYELSKKIISMQDDREEYFNDPLIKAVRGYTLPYVTVDLQRIYGLKSAGVNIDKDSGERLKFAKSLKQTSINLKWHELLDFRLPPIDEEERIAYWNKKDHYRGMAIELLNQLITNDFDRYVLPKYVKPMLYYNKNDVFLCGEIVRQKPDEVKLRYSINKAFKVNTLCSSRANIADTLVTQLYSKMSGLPKQRFIRERTERTRLSFKKIIFPHISFKTKQLQDLLEELKQVSIYRVSKDSFNKTIEFYGTTYTLATGGIHSQDPPRILKSTNDYTYCHWDYTSYYPSIIISYEIAPKHLNKKVFVDLVRYLRDTRVKCKHTKDEDGFVIEGVPNKIAAEILKIVINAIYGKLGSDTFFLYDRLAQLMVTINGQLMTMSLVEELELNGIHVVSANTDGIVLKLPKDKEAIFKEITDRWNEVNKMGADGERYKVIVSRDVNNYYDVQQNGDIEFKGAFDPKQYLKELKKGYDMPVVALAAFNYFEHNKPVMETLREHTDILDFCKTQNVGRQFEVVYDRVVDGKIESVYSQRHVRFYVANNGIIIQKENVNDKHRSKLASGKPVCILNSLDDKPITDRNINYKYYYDETYKIINPIKLGISPTAKANSIKGTKSGKINIRKYANDFLNLFDDDVN